MRETSCIPLDPFKVPFLRHAGKLYWNETLLRLKSRKCQGSLWAGSSTNLHVLILNFTISPSILKLILPGSAVTLWPIFSVIMHHHLNRKKQRESVFSQVETNVGVPAVSTPHCARAPEADSRWKNKSWWMTLLRSQQPPTRPPSLANMGDAHT